MEDPLALENRRIIYRFIEARPGTHLREMERELGLSIGVLTYHLLQLEKAGLVRTLDNGYTRKYFCNKDFDLQQRKMIGHLGPRQSRRIVLLLLEASPMRFKDIAIRLGVSKPTLTHHIKKLIKGNVVQQVRVEGDVAYLLVDREATLACMAIVTRRQDVIGSFTLIWEDLSKTEK